jgi:hypothetical protein
MKSGKTHCGLSFSYQVYDLFHVSETEGKTGKNKAGNLLDTAEAGHP